MVPCILFVIALAFCSVAVQRNEEPYPKEQQYQPQFQKFKPIKGITVIKEETRRAQSDDAYNNQEYDNLENRRLLVEYKGKFVGAPDSKIPILDCRRSNIETILEEKAQEGKPENSIFSEPKNDVQQEPENLSELDNGRRFTIIPGPRADESIYPEDLRSDSQTNLPSAGETSNEDAKDCNDELTNNRRANDEVVDPYVDYNYRKKNNEKQNQLTSNEKPSSQSSPNDKVNGESKSGNQQKVMLIENTRVCYACSTASNPNCLVPNRRTTVKYCRKGHDNCVIKSFDTNDGKHFLTRDCGSSCTDNIIPGVTPPYSKCAVCHEDLCNSAFSLNNQNIIFMCSMFFITVIRSVL